MPRTSFPLSFSQLIALTGSNPHSGRYFPSSSSQGRDWEQASIALIESAMKAGVVDYQSPVGPTGQGALILWDSVLKSGLPFKLLDMAAANHSPLGPPVEGVPALVQALHHIFADATAGNAMSRTLDWVKASSPEAIIAIDAPDQGAGEGLLKWLINTNTRSTYQASPEEWVALIDAIADKGMDWVRCSQSSLASSSLPPNLLQALYDRGLDLFAESTGTPLWKMVLDLGQPALTELISRLLDSAETPSAMGDEARFEAEKSAYLAEFFKLKPSGHSRRVSGQAEEERQRVVDHLLSRPDWVSVTDSFGRSAFFHAVLANPGVIRNALQLLNSPAQSSEDRDSWKKALTHRDERGRNIWFYVLPHSGASTFTEALIQGLLEVVPSSEDSNGQAWIVQLLSSVDSSLRAFALPGDPSPSTRLPTPKFRSHLSLSVFPVLWHTIDERAQKKAITGACRNIVASRGALEVLPETPMTLPAKVLSKMMYSPKDFLSGHHQDLIDRLFGQVGDSEGFLPVSEPLLEKMLTRLEKALASESAAKKEHAMDCFRVLERHALCTRLANELPRPSRVSPRSRF